MTPDEVFTSTLQELTQGSGESHLLADQLCAACVIALDIDGAGLSYTLLPDRRIPLGASHPQAAAAERLQYATGEGPCLTAQRRRSLIVAPLSDLQVQWPVFAAQLTARSPFRSVVALPVGGPLSGFVALDLYRYDPGAPSDRLLQDVRVVAGLLGEALAGSLTDDRDLILGLPEAFRSMPVQSRHRVWLAIGHLSAQQATTTSDALSLLRATAFSHDIDLEATADRILSGELHPPHPDHT